MRPSRQAASTPDDTPLQLVTPDGTFVASDDNARYRARIGHLDSEDLRNLYRDMVLVRRFDTEATSLQRQGELALYAPLLGQEAAQVGSGRALAPQDMAFPSYREHGVAHTRGLDMPHILQLFRGIDHGGWDPAEHNFHLYTLVIGSHALHATGYAMGVQRDGLVGTGDRTKDTAVITYFGDGATSQGDVSEALGFAAVNEAPLVLFCQNNQWAISVPTSTQTKVPLYQRGAGFGVPSIRVDGNDVLACYAATSEALDRARSGGGPTFIEAVTYRMGAHTTSDDPTRYRTAEEEQHWRDRDPVERFRTLLVTEELWDEGHAADLEAQADELGERVRSYVKGLGRPASASMFDHVYATDHSLVTEDREWFADYEASFTDTQGGAR
ncbi:pyruvate dehydrogenase (acetyl-transferring) E1 component subunit alpha [Sanguibacter sp. YZGR15]|uniref:Pyruvate dehydrogenase (Acetyl-transferring) E1 component subunit alpha n=1 Tax=Sanguibacter suaedae TaxID=2795737 RepID=A0A934I5R2_9MICO|nr:pyruvate dehydrogenase (acetyl-transferring) E1 component subunit alpha [Sanguibacter suaedae]MBI9115713.1 pyruvate dehydrogenase (acetyl-transferring) E1 component subunit alpha [Sanguibacter suaedae]